MKKQNSKTGGDISIFTEDESDQIANTVLSSRDLWIRRGPVFSRYFHTFFSLGAASSTDASSSLLRYQELARETNVWFEERLPWMHTRVEEILSGRIGDCKIEKDLAWPGFHIFHIPRFLNPIAILILEKVTNLPVDKISPLVHYDRQHRLLREHWRNYKSFDFDKTLSFTIPVLVPEKGTGMNLFKPDANSGQSICLDSVECLPIVECIEKISVEYRKGVCLYHTGKILHQANITRENMKPGEHRITIQGHGVMCDGVWRLYF